MISVNLNQHYDMVGEYKNKQMQPVGKGSKKLTSLISKQLAFVRKESIEYDQESAKQNYGKVVLSTTSPRATHNKPIATKNASPSARSKASSGAVGPTMFTQMRKSTYKKRPL